MKLLRLDSHIASHVITDMQWLQENILCLLSNAIKYSIRGTVEIKIKLLAPIELVDELEASVFSSAHAAERRSRGVDDSAERERKARQKYAHLAPSGRASSIKRLKSGNLAISPTQSRSQSQSQNRVRSSSDAKSVSPKSCSDLGSNSGPMDHESDESGGIATGAGASTSPRVHAHAHAHAELLPNAALSSIMAASSFDDTMSELDQVSRGLTLKSKPMAQRQPSKARPMPHPRH